MNDDIVVIGEDCQCHLKAEGEQAAENICGVDYHPGPGGYCAVCGHEKECHTNRCNRVFAFLHTKEAP